MLPKAPKGSPYVHGNVYLSARDSVGCEAAPTIHVEGGDLTPILK